MPLNDYACPLCGHVMEDRLKEPSYCDVCSELPDSFVLLPPLVAPATFGKGRSAESRMVWAAKERARLDKRSADYDKTPAGQEQRARAIERALKGPPR